MMFFLSVSQAYIIAVPSHQLNIKYDQPTRIFLSGRGTNLGLQLQLASLSRAKMYQQNFPLDQLVMITVIENSKHEQFLKKSGWTIIKNNTEILETKTVLHEVKKFSQIKSFEIFGHSSAIRGFQTDGDYYKSIRFDPREPEVATLKSHFAPGAYAVLLGCNSGWSIAQKLAKEWNIAVAGSFSESHFERLHSDGRYYVEKDSEAPNSRWAENNTFLDSNCDYGGCTRLRPNNRRYIGWWGDFNGPLVGHFKFFCHLNTQECQKRMAHSLYGFVAQTQLTIHSNLNDFRKVAMEYLCPVSRDRVSTKKCYENLAQLETSSGNKTVHFIEKNEQLVCDLKSCQAKIKCDFENENHSCTITDRVSQNSTTLADEYLHLINGFKTLQKDGF